MKLFILLLAVSVSGSAILPAAEPSEDSSPQASQTTDLQKLNAEYERKRAEALRPVTAWYRAKLEVLGKKIQKEGQAVEDARQSLAKTFWEDDQPELKAALCSHKWVWRSEVDAAGVPLSFAADGSVHHRGLNGTWKITGRNEITVQPEDDGAFILRFDASMTTFQGNRRGVTGERRQPAHRRVSE
jgi:hypothetical protein